MDQQSSPPELKPAERPKFGKRLPPAAQLTLLLFVAALIFAGFFAGPLTMRLLGLSLPGERQTTAAQPEAGAAFKATARQWATLKVQPVEERVFRDTTATDGRIALDDDLVTPVFSPYSGRITKLIARAGDLVSRGDPLFAIDASELAQAQNDLISASANLRTAKAQLTLATTNEKRQHDLYLAQGAALKDWQQSQVDLATAQGGMNTTSIALGAVHNRLRILGQSDADISRIEATQDVLGLSANTVVAAPIGGTVVQRQAGLGQNIVSASAGASNPVFLIGDFSKVWLVANVREEDAPKLHVGDAVEVSVLAFPDRVFRARLTYVAAAIDPATHRLPVRAEVENTSGALKPDMFANFRIITGQDVRSPAIPAVAVVYEADSAHVWVANPSDKSLEIRQITPGRSRDGMVEVVDGLKSGEQVVTAGAVFIDRAATGD
jgi:membrane fusion protein, heavy metal efflux system